MGSLTAFFLVCFLVGLGMAIISSVMGAFHAGGDTGGLGGADVGHGDLGDLSGLGHVGDAGDLGDLGHGTGAHGHGHLQTVPGKVYSHTSPLNFWVIMGFLIGFGGIGFGLSRIPYVGWLLSFAGAIPAGVLTGWLVYLFLDRILIRGTSGVLTASGALLVGTVGRLSVPVRPGGGTGELVYTQSGTRKVVSARSVDGSGLDRDQEVVVVRYEGGVAYVQSWQQFVEQQDRNK